MTTLSTKPESLVAERVRAHGESPWDCLMEIRGECSGRPLVVWESPEGEELAGVGAVQRIESSGPGRFEEAGSRLRALFGRVEAPEPLTAIGGFSFVEQGDRRGWPGFPDALFLVPERLFSRKPGGETWETRVAGPSLVSRAETAREPAGAATTERPAWIDAVRRTLDRIGEDGFSKAVLARSLVIPLPGARGAIGILAALREVYPTCCRFLIDDGRGNAFLGASPERLVRLSGPDVRSEAVAGTLRCGPDEDVEALERALRASAKDRREQEAVLRHVLEALAPLATGVRTSEPEVIRLPHLLHLRTQVAGRKRSEDILEYVARLHPTPAVAGWPRAEALDWIARVEGGPRGWYAGGVGWLDASGDGDFAVGIRSLSIRGDRARVFAGAGIVEGSDPEQEWSETELKMKGVLDAIARG